MHGSILTHCGETMFVGCEVSLFMSLEHRDFHLFVFEKQIDRYGRCMHTSTNRMLFHRKWTLFSLFLGTLFHQSQFVTEPHVIDCCKHMRWSLITLVLKGQYKTCSYSGVETFVTRQRDK